MQKKTVVFIFSTTTKEDATNYAAKSFQGKLTCAADACTVVTVPVTVTVERFTLEANRVTDSPTGDAD